MRWRVRRGGEEEGEVEEKEPLNRHDLATVMFVCV